LDDDMGDDFIKYTIMYGPKFALSFIISYIMYKQRPSKKEESFSGFAKSVAKAAKNRINKGLNKVKDKMSKKENIMEDDDDIPIHSEEAIVNTFSSIEKENAGTIKSERERKKKEKINKESYIMKNTIVLYNILDNTILKQLEVEFLNPTSSEIDEHLTKYKVNDAKSRSIGIEKILSANL
jgi:hypothetical protein